MRLDITKRTVLRHLTLKSVIELSREIQRLKQTSYLSYWELLTGRPLKKSADDRKRRLIRKIRGQMLELE